MSQEQTHEIIGLTLAISSGIFIGSSFIFQKKGLLQITANELNAHHSHDYVKNPLWLIGFLCMIIGEIANFFAYAFIPAILVTPLGAISVVVSAILSSIFLKEHLSFSGKVGCAQCILGAIIIVLHSPASPETNTIPEFFTYVFSPGFIVFFCIIFFLLFYLKWYLAPRYGTKQPIIYISICSLIGGFLVLAAQGVGSSIVYSAANPHDSQFKHWGMYPLLAFTIISAILQVHFLNRALSLFPTSVVTPVYYVFFTACTMISSAVLFQGFKVDNPASAVSMIVGFLIIVGGVALLFQYSLKLRRAAKLIEEADQTDGFLEKRNSSVDKQNPPLSPNEDVEFNSSVIALDPVALDYDERRNFMDIINSNIKLDQLPEMSELVDQNNTETVLSADALNQDSVPKKNKEKPRLSSWKRLMNQLGRRFSSDILFSDENVKNMEDGDLNETAQRGSPMDRQRSFGFVNNNNRFGSTNSPLATASSDYENTVSVSSPTSPVHGNLNSTSSSPLSAGPYWKWSWSPIADTVLRTAHSSMFLAGVIPPANEPSPECPDCGIIHESIWSESRPCSSLNSHFHSDSLPHPYSYPNFNRPFSLRDDSHQGRINNSSNNNLFRSKTITLGRIPSDSQSQAANAKSPISNDIFK